MKRSTVFAHLLLPVVLVSCGRDELPVAREAKLFLPDQPYNYNVRVDNALPTLGRVLFYDRQLSVNNSISCSSCHKQELAFADDVAFSSGFEFKLTSRNSMPIQNLGVFPAGVDPVISITPLFWDGRESDLTAMVMKPIVNHVEMGITNIPLLASKLTEIPYYKDLFNSAFHEETVTPERIAEALSYFVMSIQSNQSRFDLNKKSPQANPLTATELQGQQLFITKYNCNNCHQVQEVHGYLNAGTFANIGLDKEYVDNGLESVSNFDSDAGKFKIPSLRNVALTGPYMHDGRFETLGDVIDHYKSGIKNHPNLDFRLRNADGSARSFAITNEEKASIIAFLNTLTDHGMIQDPKFSDPFHVQ